MKLWKRVIACSALLIAGNAHAWFFTAAVPTAVYITPEGLVVVGAFDLPGVTCVTGPTSVVLAASDSQYNRKLAMVMMAHSLGRKLEVLIDDPVSTSCIAVSAVGTVPKVNSGFWWVKP